MYRMFDILEFRRLHAYDETGAIVRVHKLSCMDLNLVDRFFGILESVLGMKKCGPAGSMYTVSLTMCGYGRALFRHLLVILPTNLP